MKKYDPLEILQCPKCGRKDLPLVEHVPRRPLYFAGALGGGEQIYTTEHMKVSCLRCGYTEKRAPADTEDTP